VTLVLAALLACSEDRAPGPVLCSTDGYPLMRRTSFDRVKRFLRGAPRGPCC